jgi:hypothetical protein
MINYYKEQQTLPKRTSKSLIEKLDKLSITKIIFSGLVAYLFIVLIFTIVQYELQTPETYFGSAVGPSDFTDLLYFNFATILTIGYGDLSPRGYFRILAIVEAIIGVGIFSLFISVLTIKILLPKKTTIIFSKHGYYSLKDNRFMIIYLNTARDFIINVEICSYVKIGNDWSVSPAVKAPFITRAVQTFFLDEISINDLVKTYVPRDCFRIGISGTLGMASYSTSIEYTFENIIVIPNRNELTKYQGFWDVDNFLGTKDFNDKFHYRPENSETLFEYISMKRQGFERELNKDGKGLGK